MAVKSSWCVHCCSIHQFYWVSDHCRSWDGPWWFFVRKKLSSQIGSFHKLLVLATEISSVLTSLKDTATILWFLLRRGYAGGSWEFWVSSLVFMLLKYVSFVFILDAIFCGTSFFIFQDSVWLVKKSWCVHCFSIHQFYWVSGFCRSGFELWWFLSEKSCRHKMVVSTSFCSWLLKFLQFWHLWITQRQFFGFWCVVDMLKVNQSTIFLVWVFLFLK